MKYIIGGILGIILASSVAVYAKSISLYEVKRLRVDDPYNTLIKYYDEDNGVVCYVYGGIGGGSGAVSCLK